MMGRNVKHSDSVVKVKKKRKTTFIIIIIIRGCQLEKGTKGDLSVTGYY